MPTSHLFLSCTAAEEFIKWATATWFSSRLCWWWHHSASERQQSADTPRDISQNNICHKGMKFWGSAILSCFHMDEGFFGLHCWQRTKSFASKQATYIIMTQTWDRIQVLGFLPALGKRKESLSEQLAGTDVKMHRYWYWVSLQFSVVAHGVIANRRCDFLVRWLNLCIRIARKKIHWLDRNLSGNVPYVVMYSSC